MLKQLLELSYKLLQSCLNPSRTRAAGKVGVEGLPRFRVSRFWRFFTAEEGKFLIRLAPRLRERRLPSRPRKAFSVRVDSLLAARERLVMLAP